MKWFDKLVTQWGTIKTLAKNENLRSWFVLGKDVYQRLNEREQTFIRRALKTVGGSAITLIGYPHITKWFFEQKVVVLDLHMFTDDQPPDKEDYEKEVSRFFFWRLKKVRFIYPKTDSQFPISLPRRFNRSDEIWEVIQSYLDRLTSDLSIEHPNVPVLILSRVPPSVLVYLGYRFSAARPALIYGFHHSADKPSFHLFPVHFEPSAWQKAVHSNFLSSVGAFL